MTLSEMDASDAFIGPYRIIKLLGKGGMGEVLLVYDPACHRNIALKRIRQDLVHYPSVVSRFLKEAKITCQLNHPSIIPIYSIHRTKELTYYTMPFIEGKTLKQLIRETKQEKRAGMTPSSLGHSIPALMRVFMTICQTTAYAYSQGILHRDIKLENILLGKYGEVILLDWGVAKVLHSPCEEEASENTPLSLGSHATQWGKVIGTIAYMAPERGLGHPATIQTEIYALGVLLYYLLTLKRPFKRQSLKTFQKELRQGVYPTYIDPSIASPERDVPRILSRIVQRCLSVNTEERYATMQELIHDLEGYLQGKSDWFKWAELSLDRKEDWEFQANIFLTDRIAITHKEESSNWVNLMISRHSFSGNLKIETKLYLEEESEGVGILFSVPESSERKNIQNGYCLWLGNDLFRSTKLLRADVAVVVAPEIFLKRQEWYDIRIEKVDHSILFYLNNALQFSYFTSLPLIGTHVGILSKDAHFIAQPLHVFVGNLNITVSCLAVPDAFLAHHNFDQALSEYRRIAYSFPDRTEGREAIFRAGLTLLEKAKRAPTSQTLLQEAFEEFDALTDTPAAPLAYLGHALTYQVLGEIEEELKCFEMAYRRYPSHPSLVTIQEHLLFRLHEVSRHERIAFYSFILLTAKHLPPSQIDSHTLRLFKRVQMSWEILPFLHVHKEEELSSLSFQATLAFWLSKPYVLGELLEQAAKSDAFHLQEISTILLSLVQLGALRYAHASWQKIKPFPSFKEAALINALLSPSFIEPQTAWPDIEQLEILFIQFWVALYHVDRTLDARDYGTAHALLKKLETLSYPKEWTPHLHVRFVFLYLLENNWSKSEEVLSLYPADFLSQEGTLFPFLHNCLIQGTKQKEAAFNNIEDFFYQPYPRTWSLGNHYLSNTLPSSWFSQAFLWEKRELYRQLALYYHCAGNEEAWTFTTLAHKEFHAVD